MKQREQAGRRPRAGGAVMLAAALALMLGGCKSPAFESSPWWVPSAGPKFVTLGRSTTYALVREPGRDLLVIEDPIVKNAGEEMVGRLTWLVSVPSMAAFDRAIEVGGEGSEAWLVEQLAGGQGHAVKATGTVWVHGRTAQRLDATVHLRAAARAPTAGVPEQPTVELDRKFAFARHTPETPQYREMNTRNGMKQRTIEPK